MSTCSHVSAYVCKLKLKVDVGNDLQLLLYLIQGDRFPLSNPEAAEMTSPSH